MPKLALVVDDESSVRAYIKAVLESDGFQTLEAVDGLHGLELVRKLALSLDLLVSDIQMPKLDGLKLACSVRQEYPATPIILVSGYADTERANHPESDFEFIQKPFLPATLLSTVKMVMKARTRTASSD